MSNAMLDAGIWPSNEPEAESGAGVDVVGYDSADVSGMMRRIRVALCEADFAGHVRVEPQYPRWRKQRVWIDFAGQESPRQPQHAYDAIETQIKEASELPAEQAIRAIDEIWGRLDEMCSLAESRMRILLAQVQKPELAAEPTWMTAALSELREQAPQCHPEAVEAARKLALAFVARNAGVQATFTPSPLGAVTVRWDVPSGLRWLVVAPKLPWPGTHARVYWRSSPQLPALEAWTYHYAEGVLERSAALLG